MANYYPSGNTYGVANELRAYHYANGANTSKSQTISGSANSALFKFKTPAYTPGNANSWNGYGISMVVNITTGSTSLYGRALVYRNGVLQNSTAGETQLTAGSKIITANFDQNTIGDGGKEDIIEVHFYVRNAGTMNITFAFQIDSNATYINSSVPEFATAQPAIVKPVAQYRSDMARTPVPIGGSTDSYGNTLPLLLEADILSKAPSYAHIAQEEDAAIGVGFTNTPDYSTKDYQVRYNDLPTARRGAVLAFDSVNRRFISCGGYDGSARFSDLWELDADPSYGQWRKLMPTGTAPAGKNLGAAIQLNGDNGKSWFFYFGGSTGSDNNALQIADCTTRGSEAWTTVTQTSPPAIRSYITHHLVAKKTGANTFDVYLFGGWGNARYNDMLRVSVDMSGNVPTALTWTTLKANGTAGNPTIRSGAMCFYDDTNDRIIITNGYSGSAYLTDVWAYSIAGNSFSQLSPSGTAPEGRELMSGGYDPVSKKLVFFCGWKGSVTTNRNDIIELDFSTNTNGVWTTLKAHDYPNSDIFPFSSGAAAYDSHRRLIVEFGQNGYDATDKYVYAYSFEEGTDHLYGLNVVDDFRARDAPATVWDSTRGQMVICGGYSNMTTDEVNASATNGDHMNEIWAYNPTTNSMRYAAAGPLGMTYKEGSVAVYDSNADRILVFGGLVGSNEWCNDTWELKPDTFGNYKARIMKPSGTKPGQRWLACAAFDSARNRMIVTQGSGPAMTNDVWELDLTTGDGTWTQLTPTGAAITGVTQAGFDYDDTSKRLFIAGGATNNTLGAFTNQIAYLDLTNATPAWTSYGAPTGITMGRGQAVFCSSQYEALFLCGGFTSAIQDHLAIYYLGASTINNPAATAGVTKPEGRRSMAYARDPSTNLMYFSSGRPNTGRWFNDTWKFEYFDFEGYVAADNVRPDIYTRFTYKISGLADGTYHWQANATVAGDQADWASFGNNLESATDFRVGTASAGNQFTSTRTDTATTSDAAGKATGKTTADTSTTADAASKRATKPAADTATATDSAASSIGRTQAANDTATTADAASKASTKLAQDAVATTDAATKSQTKPAADSVTASESMAAVLQRKLSFADSVTVTDNAITITGKAMSVADAVTAAEAASKALQQLKTDSASATDAATRRSTKTTGDTVTATDGISKAPRRSAADSATATDEATRARGIGMTAGDFAYPTDANSKSMSGIKGADSVTVTDSASSGAAKSQAAADTVSAADAATKRQQLSKTDSVTANDSATQGAGRNLSRSDTVTPVDSARKAMTTPATDSASAADASTRRPGKAAADSVTLAENLSTAMNRMLAFADTITTAEQVLRRAAKTAADAVIANDAVLYAIGRRISAADSATATDATSTQAQPRPADSVTATDDQTSQIGRGATISDVVAAEDAIAKEFAKERTDEAFALDDQGDAGAARNLMIEDFVSVMEALNRSTGKLASDIVTPTDDTAKKPSTTATDSASAADASFRSPSKRPNDAAFVSDSPALVKAFVRAFTDLVTSSDAASLRASLSATDAATATESASNRTGKAAFDIVNVVDEIRRSIAKVASDAVTITENHNTNGQSNWYQNVDDTVNAIDQTFKRYASTFAETLAATDDITKLATKGQADTANAADAQRKTYTKPTADAGTVTDNEGVRFVKHPASDNVTAADTSKRALNRTISETAAALDLQAKLVRTLAADSVAVVDAIMQGVALYHYANDAVTSSEQATRAMLLNRSETLSATDSTIAVNAIRLIRADTVLAADLAARAMRHPANDSFGVLDDATVLASKGIIVNDAVSAADAAFRNVLKRNADQLAAQDVIAKAITFYIADTYGVADLSIRQTRKLLEDGAVIADATSKVILMTKHDTVSLSDEAIEDAARIVTGNIIAIAARSNNVRGQRVRGSGYRT